MRHKSLKSGEAGLDERPSLDASRKAVEKVIAWRGLAGSERLRGLIRFLSEESLQGRGDEIRAKTVALDHYGYTIDELADRESVVRVDAGRLRRKLDEYYRSDGSGDPVVIILPKGSYNPQFVYKEEEQASHPNVHHLDWVKRRKFWLTTMVAVAIVVFVSSIFLSTRNEEAKGPEERAAAERAAVFDVSPSRLQAINLAESGRDLFFPAINPERVEAALAVFVAARSTDPDYAGGHAGIAQALATLTLLRARPDASALDDARLSAERALSLAPESAWSQEAMAWVDFVGGDCSAALSRSARAMQISPLDPHIVEFEALISLFCGEFDRVISESEAVLETLAEDPGFVFTNALGAARFHNGDYLGTIAAFDTSIRGGGPTGPISVAYLMAAHHRLGRDVQAQQLADRFETSWPDMPIDQLFERLFDDLRFAQELVDAMRGAGWSNSE